MDGHSYVKYTDKSFSTETHLDQLSLKTAACRLFHIPSEFRTMYSIIIRRVLQAAEQATTTRIGLQTELISMEGKDELDHM